MATREFIHASEDIVDVLRCAVDLGMIVQYEKPSETPRIHIVDYRNFGLYDKGTFTLYKKEWVFGDSIFIPITAGHNKGKFFQSPRVNIAPITVSFDGEKLTESAHRLGGGTISRHLQWLKSEDQTLHPTPPEVKYTYDSLIRRIDIGKRLRGGVHTYMVLSHAWDKVSSGQVLPPFDFIELP